jgi:hypothetical protein
MAIIKKTTNAGENAGGGAKEPNTPLVGCKLVKPLWKSV